MEPSQDVRLRHLHWCLVLLPSLPQPENPLVGVV